MRQTIPEKLGGAMPRRGAAALGEKGLGRVLEDLKLGTKSFPFFSLREKCSGFIPCSLCTNRAIFIKWPFPELQFPAEDLGF